MAFKTVSNLQDSVGGMLQGLNLNNVTNLFTAFERVARQTCVLLDIPEATLKSNITLYDGVTDYALPTNIFASAIVDVRPQGQTRWSGDDVQKQPIADFDREKSFADSTKVTFEYNKGDGVIRIVSPYPTARIELDPMSVTTGWTAAGSASALTADETVYWEAPASLRMLLTGASTGTLTKTIPSQNLTSYLSVGVGFLAFRTPSGSNLTSLELRIGSSATSYYSVTVTTGFLKAFTSGDWMLASFDLSTATAVNSPDITKIVYTQLIVTHAATLTNFYVGDLWISLPTPASLVYQTDAIFLASGSTTPSNTIGTTADQILLNDAAYAIYELKCAIDVAQQQGGTLASGVIAMLSSELNGVHGYRGGIVQIGLLDAYRADNPSQEIRSVGSYYDL